MDRARAAHAGAADALGADTLPFLQSVVVGAGAFVAVAAGDDDTARMQLARFVDAHAPANPGVDRGLRLTFVVPYVLSPALRAQWDAVPLGPVLERKRAIAHALVAIFEGKPLPEGDAPLTALDAVCATPPPWCARLAASLVASGRVEEGREIATAFGGVARETALETLAGARTRSRSGTCTGREAAARPCGHRRRPHADDRAARAHAVAASRCVARPRALAPAPRARVARVRRRTTGRRPATRCSVRCGPISRNRRREGTCA